MYIGLIRGQQTHLDQDPNLEQWLFNSHPSLVDGGEQKGLFVIIIVVVFVVRGFLATTQILIKLAKQLDVRRRLIKVEIICIKS